MQTRPYPKADGEMCWLTREEQSQLLYAVREEPERKIAYSLGLSGLRTDEIISVTRDDVQPLSEDYALLIVQDGKTGKREVPIREETASLIRTYANARGIRKDEPVIEVIKRTLRNWLASDREVLGSDCLTMHDLRRTWATDAYYSLAFDGVPIAETLVLSFGGWKHSDKGRQTFRENYLGPVPEHITTDAAAILFE